jgi:murein DD-endopeptidase MepM/ murein hydrolase activator NlpD
LSNFAIILKQLWRQDATIAMTFKFVSQPLLSGRYEPEGIYLHAPLSGPLRIVQRWGDNVEFYGQYSYFGTPLKGHPGVDILASVGTQVLAVEKGRVVEVSYDPLGFGRYLKLEHPWGESVYAHLSETLVDAGQSTGRGALIALSGDQEGQLAPHLHFGLRIRPFHRFDGWGGFIDPLPFLSTTDLQLPDEEMPDAMPAFAPPPLVQEREGFRRP